MLDIRFLECDIVQFVQLLSPFQRIILPAFLEKKMEALCSCTIMVKTVPLQAWSGPGGSRKLRFPDFMTIAQGGDKVVSLTHRPHLPPGNSPGTHFY